MSENQSSSPESNGWFVQLWSPHTAPNQAFHNFLSVYQDVRICTCIDDISDIAPTVVPSIAPARMLALALQSGYSMLSALAEVRRQVEDILELRGSHRGDLFVFEESSLSEASADVLSFLRLPVTPTAVARLQKIAFSQVDPIMYCLAQLQFWTNSELSALEQSFLQSLTLPMECATDKLLTSAWDAAYERDDTWKAQELLLQQRSALQEQLEALYREKLNAERKWKEDIMRFETSHSYRLTAPLRKIRSFWLRR
ncbi:hypothetical protein HGE68_09355 [Rhodobacteraceae bacterium R_SAG6]|nr:hypothetical protein [Rhodobacteraceae bacterium R_SAG6]